MNWALLHPILRIASFVTGFLLVFISVDTKIFTYADTEAAQKRLRRIVRSTGLSGISALGVCELISGSALNWQHIIAATVCGIATCIFIIVAIRAVRRPNDGIYWLDMPNGKAN